MRGGLPVWASLLSTCLGSLVYEGVGDTLIRPQDSNTCLIFNIIYFSFYIEEITTRELGTYITKVMRELMHFVS